MGYDIDKVKNQSPSEIQNNMSKAWGYKDLEDYYRTSACVHRIPGIMIPSLFLNALDDPIVSKETIPYQVLEQNPNCALGTTEYGGHLGY